MRFEDALRLLRSYAKLGNEAVIYTESTDRIFTSVFTAFGAHSWYEIRSATKEILRQQLYAESSVQIPQMSLYTPAVIEFEDWQVGLIINKQLKDPRWRE